MGSPELGEIARRAIRDASQVCVSAATEWELVIKAALGKVTLHRSILEATLDAGFEPLPVTFQHAQSVRLLKPIHRDPFDRLLVATAITEGLTLVSSDSLLSKYPAPIIDARL
jgi:PIN domain nuclease of toxin-antitoxin system